MLAALPWVLSRLPGSRSGDPIATPPSQVVASGSTAAAAAQVPAHTTSGGTPVAGSTDPLSGTGPTVNNRTSPGTSSNQGAGARIARATRRTLAAGEELAFGPGLVGTDVTDHDVEWEAIPFRDSLYFVGSRRVALVPAVTDQAGCRAALAAREDHPAVEPSHFTNGGSACVVLRNGRLAQVRLTSVDPVSSAAIVEYVIY